MLGVPTATAAVDAVNALPRKPAYVFIRFSLRS